MGKPAPKAGKSSERRQREKKKKAGVTKDVDKKQQADKRREKRRSRAQSSKRKLRQGRRDDVGGRQGAVKHTVQGAIVVVPKHPLKQEFVRECMRLQAAKKRGGASKAAAGESLPALLAAALRRVSPETFFTDLSLHAPAGVIVNPVETLDILAKIERQKGGGAKPATVGAAPSDKAEKKQKDGDAAAENPKDKSSDAAVSRARQTLEERKATLPIFDALRDQRSTERATGVVKMVAYLKAAVAKSTVASVKTDDLSKVAKVEKALGSVPSYVFQRLVKGMATGVGGGRIGFAHCLAAVLRAVPQVPAEYVVSLLEAHLNPKAGGGELHSEQRHIAWGLYFGVLAVLEGGRALSRVTAMILVEKLLAVHDVLPHAREAVAVTIADVLFPSAAQQGEAAATTELLHKVLVPKIFERFFEPGSALNLGAWAPETLYLYLVFSKNASKLHSSQDRLASLQQRVNLAETATTQTLAAGLISKAGKTGKGRDSLSAYPRIHVVWPAWMAAIKESAADVSKGAPSAAATAKGRKSAVEHRLENFWAVLHPLLTATEEAKKLSRRAAKKKASKADEDADADRREADVKRRQLGHYLLEELMGVLASVPVAAVPNRLRMLAQMSLTVPSVTSVYQRGLEHAWRAEAEAASAAKAAADASAAKLSSAKLAADANEARRTADKAAAKLAAGVDTLLGQCNEVLGEGVRKIFADWALQHPESEAVAGKKKRRGDDSDSDVESDDSAASKGSAEEGQDNEEEEEPADEEEDEERGTPYRRFTFSMLRVISAELRRIAAMEAVMANHFEVFEKITVFFMTHGFFTVPEGAVDSDGLFSRESLPTPLRKGHRDAFYTLVRNVSAFATSTREVAAKIRTGASLPTFFSRLLQQFKRVAQNPGAEPLFEASSVVPSAAVDGPEAPEKKLERSVFAQLQKLELMLDEASVAKKAAAAIKAAKKKHPEAVAVPGHSLPHFASLYCLLFFDLLVENGEGAFEGQLDGDDTVVAAFATAVHEVEHVLTTCTTRSPRLLLDALLTINVRGQSESMVHLSSVISKVSLSILHYVVARHITGPDMLELLLSPLQTDAAQYQVVNDDDGDDSMGADDDSDDDDEGAGTEGGAADPVRSSKTDEASLKKQLAFARTRGLQFLSSFVDFWSSSKEKGANTLGDTFGPVVATVSRLAELSLPKLSESKRHASKTAGHHAWDREDAANMQAVAPVLAGCCSILSATARAPLSGPSALSADSTLAAFHLLCALYAKSKGKLQTREGGHLKALALKNIVSAAGLLCAQESNTTDDGQDIAAELAKGFAVVTSSRDLGARFTEEVLSAAERSPAVLHRAVLPAVQQQLACEEGDAAGRPYHVKMLLTSADAIAKRWTELKKLRSADAKAHNDTIVALTGIALSMKAEDVCRTPPPTPISAQPRYTYMNTRHHTGNRPRRVP